MGSKSSKQDEQEKICDKNENDTIVEFMSPNNVKKIGTGVECNVYTNMDNLHLAVKKSLNTYAAKEADTQKYIRNELYNFYKDKNILRFIGIPDVYNNVNIDDYSYIMMDRVVPVRTDSEEWEQYSGMAIHSYLGHEEMGVKNINNGLSVGRNVIVKSFKHIEKIDKYMGVFLAFLHYKLGYNGVGLKYIIGKTKGDSRDKIYVIDFGKIKKIECYEKEARDINKDSFNKDYMPLKNKVFRKAYAHEADVLGKGNDSLKALQNFVLTI
jgi:hypothetical protein